MKRIGIGVLALLIILVLISGLKFVMQGSAMDAQKLLPQEPLVYAEFKDLNKTIDRMSQTSLWKVLETMDYEKLLESNDIKSDYRVLVDVILKNISNPQNREVFNQFFGQSMIVSVYQPTADGEIDLANPDVMINQWMELAFSNVYIVTKLSNSAKLIEFASHLLKDYDDGYTVSDFEHMGHKYHVANIKENNVNIGYAKIKDLLVLGVGDQPVRKAIEIFEQETMSLAVDTQFQAIVRRAPKESLGINVVNIPLWRKIYMDKVEKLYPEGTSPEDQIIKQRIEESMKRMEGIGASLLTFSWENFVELASYVQIDKSKMEKTVQSFYKCEAEENATLQFIPHDVVGYYWNNCFALETYYNEMKKLSASAPKTQLPIKMSMGADWENDFFPAIDDEVGIILQDIVTGSMFPIPQITFFVKAKDKDKLDSLLDGLGGNPLMAIQKRTYKDVQISFVGLKLGNAFQPGYAFLGDYLLVSINKSLIEKSIDHYVDKNTGLLNSENFKALDNGLTRRNNQVHYVDVGNIAQKINSIIKWANVYLTSQEEKLNVQRMSSLQRLETSRLGIKTLEEELVGLRMQLKDLSVESGDTKDDIKARITEVEKDIAAHGQNINELETIMSNYEDSETKSWNKDKRRVMLDEAIYPLLESFESMGSFSGWVRHHSNAIEANMSVDLGE